MECPKCNAKVDEKKLYCPQCGHRFQLDPIEGEVMSVEEWKLKKFREKDESRKEKMEKNKNKYDTIKDRMYKQQAGFEVEDLDEEQGEGEEKKNEEKEEVLMETTPESESEEETTYPRDDKVGTLFDFEAVAGEIKKEPKGKKEKATGKKKPPKKKPKMSREERAAARAKRKEQKAKGSTLTEVLIAAEEDEEELKVVEGEVAKEVVEAEPQTKPAVLERLEAVAAQIGHQPEEEEKPKRRRRRRRIVGGEEEDQ
jgi:hypothetical protein